MGVRFTNDAIYTESAVCERLDVTPRWLRRHVPHSAIGKKRWYSGADLNSALVRHDPTAPRVTTDSARPRFLHGDDLSDVSPRVRELAKQLISGSKNRGTNSG